MGIFSKKKQSNSQKVQKMIMKSQQKELERKSKIEAKKRRRSEQVDIERSKASLAEAKMQRRKKEREAVEERYKKGASYLIPLFALKKDKKGAKKRKATRKKKLRW